MTAEQLDEIQKSLDAATPGPWEAKEKEVHTAKEDMEGYKTQVCKFTPSRIAASNIHLIANAPTWLRSLLAEVQRLNLKLKDAATAIVQQIDLAGELGQDRDRLQAEVQRQQGEIERLKNYPESVRLHFTEACNERDRLQAENDQLRQQLGEAIEALEWYGDETEMDSVYYCHPKGFGFLPSEVQEDGGQRARNLLRKLKGDRTDG
ncbi:hypothetical protein VE23_25100 [Paenibacillus sp. D9]|uniref:hypothetical protein n=1 Tax=Paenibacillus sp. D9 TaxID=665792 RepID=UPI00061E2922|nr:hypothetical protein [Paenibacillus sp. D9]KKC49572.1 hypothetical protein VE23_25100 [Paenibacillus sp. D9]